MSVVLATGNAEEEGSLEVRSSWLQWDIILPKQQLQSEIMSLKQTNKLYTSVKATLSIYDSTNPGYIKIELMFSFSC